MLRVIGIQRGAHVDEEFILLQNQGSMRVSLSGHVLMTAKALSCAGQSDALHAFNDDVLVPAGMYVLLYSGAGVPRWGRTKDGALIYFAYMARKAAVWSDLSAIHVLHTHHTFSERREQGRSQDELRGALVAGSA